jgi:hypothetical protein
MAKRCWRIAIMPFHVVCFRLVELEIKMAENCGKRGVELCMCQAGEEGWLARMLRNSSVGWNGMGKTIGGFQLGV